MSGSPARSAPGPLLMNRPASNDISAVAYLQRLCRVLFHHQDRNSLFPDPEDSVHYGLHYEGGQAQGRLVQEKDPGSLIRALEMASICCSPPERVPERCFSSP